MAEENKLCEICNQNLDQKREDLITLARSFSLQWSVIA